MQGYATELEELIAAEDRITEQSVKACQGVERVPEPGLPPMSDMAYELLVHCRYVAWKELESYNLLLRGK
jgi:hypothetical protein